MGDDRRVNQKNSNKVPYQWIWGKTDRSGTSTQSGDPAWHPLLAHLLDVAAVALELWDRYLPATVRTRLADAFGNGHEPTARAVIACLAALHDLGKASPAFQGQFATGPFTTARMRQEQQQWEQAARATGLPLPTQWKGLPHARHEHITAATLPRLLGCDCGPVNGEICDHPNHEGLHTAAYSLGGHHGHIPNPETVSKAHGADGGHTWDQLRATLIDAVANLVGVNPHHLADHIAPTRPATLPLFTGLVVLSDWIGSNEQHFPYAHPTDTCTAWWKTARHNAKAALTSLRLDRWQPTPATWEELWPGTTPRPFQADTMKLMPDQGPALVIVESDTGSGKTRLALWCAHHLAIRNGYQGLYMAMPTRAATNQVAAEIEKFIHTSVTTDAATLALVHGTASATDIVHRLVDAARPPEPDSDNTAGTLETLAHDTTGTCTTDQPEHSPEHSRAVLDPWYLRRCLGLIATFGIGTIDQLVLASQRSRHWFLRLFGLASKTVIIDEAHAYELYQQELLSAAIEWLADAGSSVVVLSATLPAAARTALTDAWCTGLRVTATDTGDKGPITVVNDRGETSRGGPLPHQAPPLHTTVRLEPDPGPQALARSLLTQASKGGCVGVVRTRVASAVTLYQHAQAQATAMGWAPEEIILLHGRLMPRDRQPLENRLAHLLGPGDEETRHRQLPNPHRPRRLLVIATQVIEQSLDLDFDHLVTDLAPVDLLIQRRGREHRHAVNNPSRPAWCATPLMSVLYRPDPTTPGLPLVEPKPPAPGHPGNADGFVYAPYTLAATYHALHTRRDHNGLIHISTPQDSSPLLEAVYGPQHTPTGPWGTLLDRTWNAWQETLTEERKQAHERGLHPYQGERRVPTEILGLASGRLHGDGDEGGASGIRAVSRLADPSTPAVCLYQQEDGTLTYDQTGTLPADLKAHSRNPADLAAHRQQQRDILLNTLTLPATWFRGKNALPARTAWPTLDHPPLRRTDVLLLDTSGNCISGPAGRITYSPLTGLAKC
ncbi:CRISPR-associated helicase Cas3' [Streptomyces sp. TRM 70351]|uniref:CRISPR-associated helicase Cas3' n=1 Tax=Streptomyces sp. TRM 70351 TaxID=3116552 RepID=UPI002E7BFF80|nr:CRISPR-associated helicase Cas3' [Streptomyces sp. TRM 70351]MEE1931296.1 CRISPR-associated helicase Cas3' [Streptomyces sp. TRM 70351]